jgi:hypothetical protein
MSMSLVGQKAAAGNEERRVALKGSMNTASIDCGGSSYFYMCIVGLLLLMLLACDRTFPATYANAVIDLYKRVLLSMFTHGKVWKTKCS